MITLTKEHIYKNPIGLTVKQMNIQSPSEFTLEQKIISEARMNHNSPNLPRGRKSAIESSLFKNKNINLNINVNININNFSNMNFINSIKKNIIEPPEKFNINDFIDNYISKQYCINHCQVKKYIQGKHI